jgi:hypothetical protein
MPSMNSLISHARNIIMDLRFGKPVGGKAKDQPFEHLGAHGFNNTDYGLLKQMFDGRIQPDDILVDVGSGRGRVLNYWLSTGHKQKIYGLELDPDYGNACAERLKRWPNVEIRVGDALALLPSEGTLFYLSNPFAAEIMLKFTDAIWHAVADKRRLRIIYFAPTSIEIWTADKRWAVEVINLDMSAIGKHAERHKRYAVITPKL